MAEPQYPAQPAPALPPVPASPAQPSGGYQYPLALYPPLLPYRAGVPVPPGYVVKDRPAKALYIGGLVMLLASYGAAIMIGAGEDFENGTGWLAAPIVGPWAAIGARSFRCSQPLEQSRKCVNEAFDEVAMVVFMTADGLVQATGAVLFAAGLASGSKELVRQDLKNVSVGPRRIGRDGYGVGVQGVF